MSSQVPTPDQGLIDASEIAVLLNVSPTTAQKLIEKSAIPSVADSAGQRRATRADVAAWRKLRDRRRATIAELVELAQLTEPEMYPPLRHDSQDPNVEEPQFSAPATPAAEMPVRAAVPSRARSMSLAPDADLPDVVAARLAAAVIRATEVIGGRAPAERWLSSTPHCFDGLTPAELLCTESGAIEVDRALGRIQQLIAG